MLPPGQVELLFLGTGTSAGVPMIGCHCAVCSSSDARDKRTRASVVISYNETRVLVDTTPELRLQCVANSVDRIDAIVFTHAHADHIMGLDDVRRFNVTRQGPLDVWADEPTFESIARCFGYAFRQPDPPDGMFRPNLIRHRIDGPFDIAGITWTPIPLMHGTEPVLGFRIGKLAYCTDVNEIPESSYELLHDLDVFVIDALHHKRHAKHFSLEQAIEASNRVSPRLTLFTHISHGIAHVETSRLLPPHMHLGFDGQRVTAGAA